VHCSITDYIFSNIVSRLQADVYFSSPDVASSSTFGVSPALTLYSPWSSSSNTSNSVSTPSTNPSSSLSPAVTHSPASMISPTLPLAPGSTSVTSYKLERQQRGSTALYRDSIPVNTDQAEDCAVEVVDVGRKLRSSSSEHVNSVYKDEYRSSRASSVEVVIEGRRRGRPRGSGAKSAAGTSLRTILPTPAVAAEAGPSSRRVGEKSKRSQRDDDGDEDDNSADSGFKDGHFDKLGTDENDDNKVVSNVVASSAKRVKTSLSSPVPSKGGPPKKARVRRRKSTTTKKQRLICTLCGQTFGRATDLRRHEATAICNGDTSLKEPSYCAFCRKPFYRLDALTRHEDTVHTKV